MMQAINIKIGERVAMASRARKPLMSQATLSQRLKTAGADMGRREIAKLEKGLRNLNYYELSLLASVLNKSAHWLLTGMGD